jgi:hypothetical protein
VVVFDCQQDMESTTTALPTTEEAVIWSWWEAIAPTSGGDRLLIKYHELVAFSWTISPCI